MRVAHFIQRYPPALGGSEAYFARLSRFLVDEGDQVTVFTSDAIDLEGFWSRRVHRAAAGVTTEDGVEVRRYPLWHWPGRRYLLKLLNLVPQRLWQCLTLPCNPISPALWRAARRLDRPFDVVHASAFPYAWPIACARRLARRWQVPFLLTPFLHLGDPDDSHDSTRRAYTSPALRWLLRQADGVFVQTRAEQKAVEELGVAPERIVLQGLGVEPSECSGGHRVGARRLWGLGADEIIIGHLANQSREKGTVDLLKAASALWQRGLAARVLLAGPEMSNFRAYWKTYDCQQRVVRLGVLNDQEKRAFFAAIDIFALPSRSDSFGLTLLEAWANGLPNIAYRAGGVAELIHHDGDGLLVACGNVEQLAAGLARFVTPRANGAGSGIVAGSGRGVNLRGRINFTWFGKHILTGPDAARAPLWVAANQNMWETTMLDPRKQVFSLMDEFKQFALKGNVIDLAVGVIIGAAFGKIVDSLVKNIIMPLIGAILPGDQGYTGWTFIINGKPVQYGLFLGEVVNFLIVALALFIFIVKFLGFIMRNKKEEVVAPPPPTKEEVLLMEIRDAIKAKQP